MIGKCRRSTKEKLSQKTSYSMQFLTNDQTYQTFYGFLGLKNPGKMSKENKNYLSMYENV